jgi:MtN3 and saliva related transmembrane protein
MPLPAWQWLLSVQAFQLLITIYGTGMAAGPLVQAWKIWRARSARDVSLFSFSLIGFGCALWLVWGVRSINLPLIVANTGGVAAYALAVGMILRYRRTPVTSQIIADGALG